jgi:hypothetical protein
MWGTAHSLAVLHDAQPRRRVTFEGDIMRKILLAALLAAVALASSASALIDVPKPCGAVAVIALTDQEDDEVAHGGGLNSCGCHFNRKTGECHCHQNRGCGCECQPGSCP